MRCVIEDIALICAVLDEAKQALKIDCTGQILWDGGIHMLSDLVACELGGKAGDYEK